MENDKEFIPQKGGYRDLIAFQKATCIYDITYYFAHKFLDRTDRTVDQMIQAARSGRQNIAEGSAAATTSRETELKLTNVAKASLQELLLDYEDYLRQNGLVQWGISDVRTVKARDICKRHNDTEFYMKQIPSRSAEAIANIAIITVPSSRHSPQTVDREDKRSEFPEKRWKSGKEMTEGQNCLSATEWVEEVRK